ncbi:hypothetical protein V865_006076 [Kwoniella europaea PYCC6329]|uniref:Uncharacterized protein n=1 Tax=Kwoniella europaea PYCC6329 TaxID=1423913 RepID=A0AAX4KNE7_9TREE
MSTSQSKNDDGFYHEDGICDWSTSRGQPPSLSDKDIHHAMLGAQLYTSISKNTTVSKRERNADRDLLQTFKNRNYVDSGGSTAAEVYGRLEVKYGLGPPEPDTKPGLDTVGIGASSKDTELPRTGMVRRRVSDIESNSGSEIAPHYASSTKASDARRSSSVGSESPSTPSSPRFSFSASAGSSPPSPRARRDSFISLGVTSRTDGLGITGFDTALEESPDEA